MDSELQPYYTPTPIDDELLEMGLRDNSTKMEEAIKHGVVYMMEFGRLFNELSSHGRKFVHFSTFKEFKDNSILHPIIHPLTDDQMRYIEIYLDIQRL